MLSHPWLQAQGAPDRPLDSVVMQRVAAFSAANQLRRAALVQVARSLPPTKVAGLRALFKAFDADGDGVLTPDELQAAVARFNGSAADGAELDTAVAAAGASDAGTVCKSSPPGHPTNTTRPASSSRAVSRAASRRVAATSMMTTS